VQELSFTNGFPFGFTNGILANTDAEEQGQILESEILRLDD